MLQWEKGLSLAPVTRLNEVNQILSERGSAQPCHVAGLA